MRLLRQIWITLAVLVGAFAVSWIVYMPSAQHRGVWHAQAHAATLQLTPLTATLYSDTRHSCYERLRFPAHLKLVEWAEGAVIAVDGDTLTLSVDGSLDPMIFTRRAALPDTCTTTTAGTAPDTPTTARDVFDALWIAMNDHYAHFDLYDVDWDARRALAPAHDARLNDADLRDLLMETLSGLNDGHIQLGTPLGVTSPAQPPPWLPEGANRETLTAMAYDTIGTDLTPVELTAIAYTVLPDGVGYVSIPYMDMNTPFGTTSGSAMARAFEDVATALQDTRAIILDIRYNPGGSDTVAFGIASHFVDAPRAVFTKTTRTGDSQTDPFTAAIVPYDDTPLRQPVLLLTTELTGSAAEIFTIALRDQPNVTTMGSATSGDLSDILGVTLPNGWQLGLSHQTYLTQAGEAFEGTGIPPDIAVPTTADTIEAGQDALLRAAFAWARDQ